MACSTHISHKHLAGPGCYTYFFLRQSPNGPQGGIRVKGNDVDNLSCFTGVDWKIGGGVPQRVGPVGGGRRRGRGRGRGRG
eukprot:9421624-Pyramimonas_sp.AAC.1